MKKNTNYQNNKNNNNKNKEFKKWLNLELNKNKATVSRTAGELKVHK